MKRFYHDNTYLDLIHHIFLTGTEKTDRTGTGTLSTFGYQMRFNLEDGTIPLLTTKKMHTRSIIYEILWYLHGDTNIKYLQENGVRIWNEWADENGDLGPVYGKQWRNWGGKTDGTDGIDQIATVIEQLKTNPNDRRIIVNAWNVGDLEQMALPPCHAFFQFYVADNKLSCQLYQRSCDVGLGVPFNIVQYSILTHMIAHVTGLNPGEFIWTGGDVHIYKNHFDALKEQLQRKAFPSPRLVLNPEINNIDDFKFDDFEIVGYDNYHPTIKMNVAV